MQTNSPTNSVKELPLEDVWVGNPLSSEQATVLADGLLAIAHQAHNYPETEELSINHWLSWLDEGGYDQVGFSEALQRICQRLLSVDDYKQLVALASGSANATRGLSAAIDHLSEHHSALLEQIHDIEKWRLADLEAIQATAGGLSKKAKIGLIAGGTYVGVSLVGGMVGAVGYFRARARAEAHDLLVSQAQDRMHEEFNKKWDEFLPNMENRPIDKLSNDKFFEHFIPLVEQTPDQIKSNAILARNQMSYVHSIQHSHFGCEISARLLQACHPDVYLERFNHWAKEEVIDRFSGPINEYSRIKDIDVSMRRKFETSESMASYLRSDAFLEVYRDTGIQHFWTKACLDYYIKKFSEAQVYLQQARAKGVFSDEDNYLNNHTELIDMSDNGARNFISSCGDAPFSYAIEWDGFRKIWTQLMVDQFKSPLSDKLQDALAEYKLGYEALSISLGQDFKAGKLKADARDKLLKDFGTKEVSRLDAKDGNLQFNFVDEIIKPAYIKERSELAECAMHDADNEARSEALKKLSDLDDVKGWYLDRIETTKQEFAKYLESDACKAYRTARANAEAAFQDAGKTID